MTGGGGDEVLTPEEVRAREKVDLTFSDLGMKVEACVGESLLQAALRHGVEIEHSCGGFTACSTCHVIVESGMEHLTEPTEEEEDHLDEAVGQTLRSRLACSAGIRGGPIVLRIGPHR